MLREALVKGRTRSGRSMEYPTFLLLGDAPSAERDIECLHSYCRSPLIRNRTKDPRE